MQITIHEQDYKLDEKEKDYLYKKIEHLSHYGERIDDESTTVRVDVISNKIKTSTNHVTLHVTMHIPHGTIRAEVEASTLQEGIDLAVDKLKKQIERYKKD